jgi:hypothetical protein
MIPAVIPPRFSHSQSSKARTGYGQNFFSRKRKDFTFLFIEQKKGTSLLGGDYIICYRDSVDVPGCWDDYSFLDAWKQRAARFRRCRLCDVPKSSRQSAELQRQDLCA